MAEMERFNSAHLQCMAERDNKSSEDKVGNAFKAVPVETNALDTLVDAPSAPETLVLTVDVPEAIESIVNALPIDVPEAHPVETTVDAHGALESTVDTFTADY